MKKSTIIVLAIVMGISFASLLIMQMRYIEEVTSLRYEYFEESVNRSLYETAHQLELSETKRYLEEGSDAMNGIALHTIPFMPTQTLRLYSACIR